ncbi:LOW QUALITY PROTEIN: hypothetical protein HID58_004000 [Brassica napus]|uniref:Uncharacterized protein n=1 Tax=Brassica napus TaxID=3708 RepID=A0ABQ7XIF1_BRANA|nr:LOW QUALITY PROTEIN: hypothetical protein HID58_004000 [Brassica napus]
MTGYQTRELEAANSMSCIRYGEGERVWRMVGVLYLASKLERLLPLRCHIGFVNTDLVLLRAPVQISNDKDFDLSLRHVRWTVHQRICHIQRGSRWENPLSEANGESFEVKEVASSNEMQVGSTSADVHTRNEVNDGETDLTEDEIILMGVAEIEAVYASNCFGMREVDGTICEVQNKVDTTEDAALGEGEDDDDEDYDYNLWHDFVVVVERTYIWRCSGPSTNKQRTANPPSTFEDYAHLGFRWRIEEASNNLGVKSSDQVADTENHSDPNQEEDPSLDNNSQMLVLQTPPKPFNMHTREVDDSDDLVGQVPQCVSSRPTHDTSNGVYEDDDFVEPVPMCVSGGQTHETPDGEDEDDDFVEPVPHSRSREEDARRRREKIG